MGIEKFFNTLKNKYAEKIITDVGTTYNEKFLFVDFNSIIYQEAGKIESALKNLYKTYLISLQKSNYLIENKEEIDKYLNYLRTDLIIDKLNFNSLKVSDLNDNFFILNKKYFEKLLLNKIGDYLKYLICLFKNLTYLYISIDGVPLFAKMLHQKTRRFNKYFTNKAQKKLIKYYKKELNQEINLGKNIFFNQYEFEKKILKFRFNTNKISPATNFMIKLENYLLLLFKNEKFEFILDGFRNSGEAEMKIFVKLKSMDINNIIVFSPDSDVILLMMLLFRNIVILRYNQQLHKLENISINNYKNILLEYLKIEKFSKETQNKIIINIIMILTVLGNDFIPKIIDINTFRHIDLILNSYLDINKNINNENHYQYIFSENVNYSLLLNYFINLENKLKLDTNFILKKKYRYENKENYNNYYKHLYDLENLFNKYQMEFKPNNQKYKYYKKYFISYTWLYEYYINNNFSYKLFGINDFFIPNLSNIILYLKKFISKDNISLNKYFIEEDKFLNPIYHLAFISPTPVLKFIDKNTNENIINKLNEYDKKFNNKIDVEIKNGMINIFKYFNCFDKLFFNNCYLLLLKKIKIKKIIKFFNL